MANLTQAQLKKMLSYSPETGLFVWLPRQHGNQRWPIHRWNRKYAGQAAGTLKPEGYLDIAISRRAYKAHRLAWLYVYGEWPAGHLDHIDGKRDHNAIANLRAATTSQNLANSKRYVTNSIGFKSVTRTARGKPWRSRIQFEGQRFHLGVFDTPEEAHAVYCAAAIRLFGKYARPAEHQ